MTSLDSISGSLIQTFFSGVCDSPGSNYNETREWKYFMHKYLKKPEDAKHVLPFLVYLEIVSSFKLLLDSATK